MTTFKRLTVATALAPSQSIRRLKSNHCDRYRYYCASRQSPSRPYVRPLVSPVWKKKGGVGAPPVISHTNSVDSFGNSAGWSGVDSCRCVQRRQHGGGDDAVARRPGGGGEGSCAPPTGSADSYACRRGAAIGCFSAPQKPDLVLCFRACAAVPRRATATASPGPQRAARRSDPDCCVGELAA